MLEASRLSSRCPFHKREPAHVSNIVPNNAKGSQIYPSSLAVSRESLKLHIIYYLWKG